MNLGFVLASDIVPSKPEWVWREWLLARAVNLLVGRQGSGKTTFAAHLIAAITNGRALPGDEARPPMTAAILSLEEPRDRLVARLKAAGAALDKVIVLTDVLDIDPDSGRTFYRPWRLPEDVSILGQRIIEHGIRFLVVDGIGYSIAGDSNSYAVVGTALAALGAEADRTGVSVLGLVHPPKGGSEAVTSAIGSTAWTAIPRLVMTLGPDPTDETKVRKAVNVGKSNYRMPDRGLSFVILSDDEFECGYVGGVEGSDVSADAIMAAQPTEEERGALSEAKEFLFDLLSDGVVKYDAVVAEAKKYGIALTTLNRAKKALDIKPTHAGGFGKDGWWEWGLPHITPGHSKDGQDPSHITPGHSKDGQADAKKVKDGQDSEVDYLCADQGFTDSEGGVSARGSHERPVDHLLQASTLEAEEWEALREIIGSFGDDDYRTREFGAISEAVTEREGNADAQSFTPDEVDELRRIVALPDPEPETQHIATFSAIEDSDTEALLLEAFPDAEVVEDSPEPTDDDRLTIFRAKYKKLDRTAPTAVRVREMVAVIRKGAGVDSGTPLEPWMFKDGQLAALEALLKDVAA